MKVILDEKITTVRAGKKQDIFAYKKNTISTLKSKKA